MERSATKRGTGLLAWSMCTTLSLVACSSRNIVDRGATLQLGMAPADVIANVGEPTVREAFLRDGKRVEYWSYLVGHRLFSHSNTYRCLVFTDDHLTEVVEDFGVGGHSNHRSK